MSANTIIQHVFSSQEIQKIKEQVKLWLVWLSGLSVGLTTESYHSFPVRAHAWDAVQGPQMGVCERQQKKTQNSETAGEKTGWNI